MARALFFAALWLLLGIASADLDTSLVNSWARAFALSGNHTAAVWSFTYSRYLSNINSNFLYGFSVGDEADGSVRVWGGARRVRSWFDAGSSDGTTAPTLRLFTGETFKALYSVDASPNGIMVAAGSESGKLYVWGDGTGNNIYQVTRWSLRNAPAIATTGASNPNHCSSADSKPYPYWSPSGTRLLVACRRLDLKTPAVLNDKTLTEFALFTPTVTTGTPGSIALGNDRGNVLGWSILKSGPNYYYYGRPTGPAAWFPDTNDPYAVVGVFDIEVTSTLSFARLSIVVPPPTGNSWVQGSIIDIACAGVQSKYSAYNTQCGVKMKRQAPTDTSLYSVRALTFSTGPITGQSSTNRYLAFQQDAMCFTSVRILGSTPPTALVGSASFTWFVDGLAGGGSLAFSPDNKYLAVACTDAYVRIFNALTWSQAPERIINTFSGVVYTVAFNPTGEFITAGVAPATILFYGGCPAGTNANSFTSKTMTCSNCLAGTSNSDLGGQCTACPSGFFQDLLGQSSCKTCPSGFIPAAATGALSCTACLAGTYAADTGVSICTDCDVGFFQPNRNRTRCDACPPGKLQTLTKQTRCTDCPAGSFSDDYASTACAPCL